MMKIIALFLCLKWGILGCFLGKNEKRAYFHAYFCLGSFGRGGMETVSCTFTSKTSFDPTIIKPRTYPMGDEVVCVCDKGALRK